MFIAFKKEETQKIVELLGFDSKNIKCVICRKKLKIKDIGNFVHYKGKRSILCDDLGCFVRWIVKEKPELYRLKKRITKKKKSARIKLSKSYKKKEVRKCEIINLFIKE